MIHKGLDSGDVFYKTICATRMEGQKAASRGIQWANPRRPRELVRRGPRGHAFATPLPIASVPPSLPRIASIPPSLPHIASAPPSRPCIASLPPSRPCIAFVARLRLLPSPIWARALPRPPAFDAPATREVKRARAYEGSSYIVYEYEGRSVGARVHEYEGRSEGAHLCPLASTRPPLSNSQPLRTSAAPRGFG